MNVKNKKSYMTPFYMGLCAIDFIKMFVIWVSHLFSGAIPLEYAPYRFTALLKWHSNIKYLCNVCLWFVFPKCVKRNTSLDESDEKCHMKPKITLYTYGIFGLSSHKSWTIDIKNTSKYFVQSSLIEYKSFRSRKNGVRNKRKKMKFLPNKNHKNYEFTW